MNSQKCHYISLILVICCVVSSSNLTCSQELSTLEIIEKAWPCVVKIQVFDKNDDIYSGTGFFISPNRILTCEHLMEKACYAVIKFDEKNPQLIFNEAIKVLKIDKNEDLALLEVEKQHQFHLALEDTFEYRPGQPVYTVGFPLGGPKTASEGIISTKTFRGSQIGFTAPVSSGNSGSPVLNENGHVIGLFIVSMEEGQNLNGAVDIKTIQEFLAKPDKPYKLGTGDDTEEEDSTPLILSALKMVKKTGYDVVNFIVFTGRGFFFIIVDIVILLIVILFIIAAVQSILRSFKEDTYKQKLRKLILIFLTSSMLVIWIIIGISFYNLLFPLFGKDGFLVSSSAVGTSIIIGTFFYFLLKKIWKRHANTS